MVNSVTISPSSRTVQPGPLKKASRGTTRSPLALLILTSVPKTSNGGAVSDEGTAVQMFPPMVPTFRIWTEPKTSTASVRAVKSLLMSGDFSMVRWVTVGPIRNSPSWSIRFRPEIPCKEMRTSGEMAFFLTSTMISVPPATSAAFLPYRSSRLRVSSTVAGF